MIGTKDLFHLPILDQALQQWDDDFPSLTVIAGFDPPEDYQLSSLSSPSSGRAGFFRILVSRLLTQNSRINALNFAPPNAHMRLPRQLARRVKQISLSAENPTKMLAEDLLRAKKRLVILHELDQETLPVLAACLEHNIPILTQHNSPMRGQALITSFIQTPLEYPAYIFGVDRVPKLCPACKVSQIPAKVHIDKIPISFATNPDQSWYTSSKCPNCRNTGSQGEITIFDIQKIEPGTGSAIHLIDESTYLLQLAIEGHLSLETAIEFPQRRLTKLFSAYTAMHEISSQTTQDRDRLELQQDISNIVLENRTAALFALEDMSASLANSIDLPSLAQKIQTRSLEISGAEKSVLYLIDEEKGTAEIIGENGWSAPVTPTLPLQDCKTIFPVIGIIDYTQPPIGYSPDTKTKIQSGLAIPLMAEGQQLGLLLIQSTKKIIFSHNEKAILRTFANNAALAIQRQALIDQRIEKERLERELDLAHEVQQSILPKTFPQVPGIQISAQNLPARQVGGDFYDIFLRDENSLGLVIGDVSDKGFPAALYMTLTRSLMLAEARRTPSPAEAVKNVNSLLEEIGENKAFISLFYGVIDIQTKSLTYARAGHDYPLLLRNHTITSLKSDGTVLGVFDSSQFHLGETMLQLEQDDKIILYTDGIIDTQNPSGERFGLSNLKTILQENAQLTPADLTAAIFDTIQSFQNHSLQFDDTTLVIFSID